MIFNKTTIVLVRPQLPENIGMVARTMDNFGFKNLTLVLPREKWPNKKSLQASKHAKKIIENYENEIVNFYQVCPKEMLNKLDNPITLNKKIGIAS